MDELVSRVEDLATRVEKLIQCTENDARPAGWKLISR
jgi:hypothetical protein